MPAGDAVGSASTAPSYAAPREAQGPSQEQAALNKTFISLRSPFSMFYSESTWPSQPVLHAPSHPTSHPNTTWSNAALLPTPPQEGNEGLRMERDMRQVRGGLRSQFARFARMVAIQLSPPTSG